MLPSWFDLAIIVAFALLILWIFTRYKFTADNVYLHIDRRKKIPPPDTRALVRSHTNEMERELIAQGMNEFFTETTWDESTVIEAASVQTAAESISRAAMSFISPHYERPNPDGVLSAEDIHKMSMHEYEVAREDLLKDGVYDISPTLEISGPKTQHCRWCHRATQRTIGGLCSTCHNAGVR